MAELAEPSIAPERPHPPGEIGVWVFLLADMSLFASYFAVFLLDRAAHPADFAEGRASMATNLGATNTVLLLVSSWCMARAVEAARNTELASFRRATAETITCGLLFLGLKSVEYSGKVHAGIGITTNVFFRDYFAFTGFHAFHVLIGLSLIAYARFASATERRLAANVRFVEGAGAYWHMVDLLWVVLFALLYLVPGP